MKKLLSLFLALALLLTGMAWGALADGGLADYVCKEESFATKIPLSGSSGYVENTGLVIYTDVPGYIPYVIVRRRPMDKKFNNPVNYLNNVYREYLENKHGDNSLGMNPARKWDVGGRELLGARYMYKIGDTTVVQLQLIDVRDAGDVEYTAKFIDGKDAATMDALDAAVRYYRETDVPAPAPQPTEEPLPTEQPTAEPVAPAPQASSAVVTPMDISGVKVDKETGTYRVRITDADKVDAGGYFTAELYVEDTYLNSDINALQPGDRVQVVGSVWTVDQMIPVEAGVEVRVREDFDGYIVFRKATDSTCTALVNDWTPSTLLGTEKIMLPLPYRFSFLWMGGDDSADVYDADSFIGMLRNGSAPELVQYNTMIRFSEGLVEMIVHSDYPAGPDGEIAAAEPTAEPASGRHPASQPTAEPAAQAAPSFLTPAVFTANYNQLMLALADQFADVLGADTAELIRNSYQITETDPLGLTQYYGNADWSVETGFMYADAAKTSQDDPAILVNMTIRNSVPDVVAFFARYTLQMMIGWEYKDQISTDDLANWFDNASDPSDVFELPGYTLCVIPGEEYTQYAVLPPADRNPLLN